MNITVTNNISSGGSITVYSDSTLNPTTEICADDTIATKSPISFMVLSGNYYTLTVSGTVSLVCWTEWS